MITTLLRDLVLKGRYLVLALELGGVRSDSNAVSTLVASGTPFELSASLFLMPFIVVFLFSSILVWILEGWKSMFPNLVWLSPPFLLSSATI